METENQALDELADAVLEGQPVDWASAESTPGATGREVVQQLRVLERIAGLHRSLIHDTPVSARPEIPSEGPKRWGRLEILECIGRGSFGEVHRAWDSKLDREVAVKLLHAGGGQHGSSGSTTSAATASVGGGQPADTVLKEARLLARVRHPNVVTVYDADEIEGRVGLWMEFIHGRNLEQILRERKQFGDGEVTRIGVELCRALSAVHEAGLLHRDVKTQNLMQADDGRLVLMDFGTGRQLEETPGSRVDAAGTPLYLAPEIFGGAPATVRTDLYSAGVALFHLLTGAYPVRGASVGDVGAAHASGRRLDLAASAPGVSKTLAAAIGRAIEPDPSRRFESARDMLAALEDVQRRAERPTRNGYWLALGAAALIAIALAVIPSLMGRNRDPKSRAGAAPYVGLTPERRAVQGPPAMAMGTPSPDGAYLPYSEFGTGNLALYEFATGASRVLTSSGDGGHSRYSTESIVSADSSQIAYNWNDSDCDCTELRVIDAGGARDRILYGGRGVPDVVPLEWSRDGRQILATRQRTTGETDAVLISLLDGSVSLVRTFEHAPFKISLSPDGRYVAYDRAEDSQGTDYGIFLSATDGSREVPVVTGPTFDSHPLWTPDGSGLVFASMRTGGPGLWLQPIEDGRAHGRPRLLDKDIGPFGPVTLTRRGSLFYSHRTGLMDVYTALIDPATGNVTGEPTNAAGAFLGSNISPDWSPDGRTLVFASWRTLFGPGRNILVFHAMDTGLERELVLDLELVNAPHWSPDGRLISVGGVDRKGLHGGRLIDVESGSVVSTFLATSGDAPAYNAFAWDLDGRHAYLKRSGPQKISRMDTSTGEEELVYEPPPDSVLGHLSISPDGHWLALALFMRPAKRWHLIVIPAGGGRSRDLLDMPGSGSLTVGGWTRDGRHILFTKTTPDSEGKQVGELWAVPFDGDGGPPRSLGLSMRALRDVRVSPDGTRVAFTSGFPDQGLWVFENFLSQAGPR